MKFNTYFKHNYPIKMIFTERLGNEVCYTDDEILIRKNCQRLHLELDEIDTLLNAIDVHRYNHFVLCICKEAGKLSQYVFPTSANKRVVKEILKKFPKEAALLILTKGDFPDYSFLLKEPLSE